MPAFAAWSVAPRGSVNFVGESMRIMRISEKTAKPLRLPVTTFVACSTALLMFFGSLYCKQYEPRSDCS